MALNASMRRPNSEPGRSGRPKKSTKGEGVLLCERGVTPPASVGITRPSPRCLAPPRSWSSRPEWRPCRYV